MGIKVSLLCITKNRIKNLLLSALEEVVRSLNSYGTNHHVRILHEQLEIMSAKATNTRTPNSNSPNYSAMKSLYALLDITPSPDPYTTSCEKISSYFR